MLSKGYRCYPYNEMVKMNPNITAGKKKKKKKSGPQACREMELWGSKKINTVNNVMLALENEERDLNAL